MKAFSVVEILQISFAGIAFLLAFLAYRLLAREGNQERPRPNLLKSINSYMIFAFLIGFLAISAQVFSSFSKPPSADEVISELKKLETRVADSEKSIQRTDRRIDGIKLTALEKNPSSPYSCGGEQKAEAGTLTVMSGLRDGTSCKVQNVNYYKEIAVSIPK